MSLIIDIIKKKVNGTDVRSSKMRKNTIAMLGIRGISILLSLFSAPIMLHHVDRADYGILLTLTSIVHWIGMMDIGLGNGLRNKLPQYLVTNNVTKAKEAISSCYGAMAIYIFILIGVFLITSQFINWIDVLNSPNSNEEEILGLVNVVFVAFCFQFLFGLINSILFAYQLPAYQAILSLLGQFLALIALIVQVYVFNVDSVFQIGSINCIIPPIVILGGSLFLFRGKLKNVAPQFDLINLKSVGGILSIGIKFFILQIITIVLFQANNIIITRSVGPEAVVEYNLAFKYITILTMLFNIIVTPIWSATTDAYIRNDFDWIRKTVRSRKKIAMYIIGGGILMVLISKPVYDVWLGNGTIEVSYTTTALVMTYSAFDILYRLYGTIINGTGKVYAQMIITGLLAIAYIPLASFMGKSIGLSGVLIANTIVFFMNYLWSKIQCTKILNGTAVGFWNK